MPRRGPVRTVSFSPPERQENEDDITKKQLDYIKHLAPHIDLEPIKKFGKWQASALIDFIKDEHEDSEDDFDEDINNQSSYGNLKPQYIVFAVLFILLLFLLGKC